ncbi:hypothetical protein AB1Y20_004635 [Prymnesium parvum]|uniref:5'-3' exoribonuclease n=1 Tax=Prymnesium parvum TaxID=97485 RepID=A0AB34IZC5_PRYPA
MGVPRFFRWLCERYPQINRRISEGRRSTDYVDNFYLDMNGIIHQCTHGDGVPPGANPSEEAMIQRIFEYTDRLIRIAKPRKLLYLAIDGVAPRAKMNQQRSRRYRAPREMEQEARRKAATPPPPITSAAAAMVLPAEPPAEAEPFDSNCITPGTEFLQLLGERYKRWIEAKQRDDPAWARLTVVFSGADVVGEGEHKIMDFIREACADGHTPTHHCMYGLDADLIMLGMVTHEPQFLLLRERQRFQKGKLAPRKGGKAARGRGAVDSAEVAEADADDRDFIFLEVQLLRGLLAGTLRPAMDDDALGFEWSAERAVDDFVFMCMLVGNDFIPGLSHLDVADGALNLMLRTYTDLLPSLGGYLTDKSRLHFGRFERYVRALASHEPVVFAARARKAAGRFSRGAAERPLDYKRRYYLQKLGLHPKDDAGLRAAVQSYLDGLCWCLTYYHEGCLSWDWYYPDFYAPLASDLRGLEQFEVKLPLGKPFPPLAQLLSVLPPQSAQLVPEAYRSLMLDPTSPVFDAFPAKFELDANGKRQEWEAIALLPFIDEVRLLKAVAQIDGARLTEAEHARNVLGHDLYYSPVSSAVEEGVQVERKEEEVGGVEEDELVALTVPMLKQRLKAMGVSTAGRKSELVERLRAQMGSG